MVTIPISNREQKKQKQKYNNNNNKNNNSLFQTFVHIHNKT